MVFLGPNSINSVYGPSGSGSFKGPFKGRFFKLDGRRVQRSGPLRVWEFMGLGKRSLKKEPYRSLEGTLKIPRRNPKDPLKEP